jgi:hypothetical protein
MFTLDLDEALAVLFCRQAAFDQAQEGEPCWPAFVTAQQRVALLTEARRVVEEAANGTLARCCPPPKKERKLRVVSKRELL